MPTLIAILLIVFAIAVVFAFAKLIVGAVILALGVVAGLCLWNRYFRGSSSDTVSTT